MTIGAGPVRRVPEGATPSVLHRLAEAASTAGKMPEQAPRTAPVYEQLAAALDQLGIALG